MASTLEKLPTEILAMILGSVDDFYGLESLLKSSPRLESVFQHDCINITESVLNNCSITKPQPQSVRQYSARRIQDWDGPVAVSSTCDIHELFRKVVYMRTPSFRWKFLGMGCSTVMYIPTSLADCLNLPFRGRSELEASSVMHGMIKIAAQIQRLACVCLSMMLKDFQCAIEKTPYISIRRSHSAFGPPSWIEEVRVYRALWKLQIYSEFYKAVRSTGSNSHYAMARERFPHKKDLLSFKNKEIICVYQVLKHVVRLPEPEIPPQTDKGGFFCSSDYPPFFLSLELKENAIKPSVWAPPPVPSMDSKVSRSWRLSPEYRHSPTEGIEDFEKLPRPDDRGTYDDTEESDLESFRALGIYIWDSWRSYSAGLMEPPIEKRSTPDGDYSTYSDRRRGKRFDELEDARIDALLSLIPPSRADPQLLHELKITATNLD